MQQRMAAGMLRASPVLGREDEPRWYVCSVLHQLCGQRSGEMVAAHNIGELGYETYIPLELRHRPGKPDAIRPVFVGYVFVQFDAKSDPDWPLINRTVGVRRLFMQSHAIPSPLPVGWVESWRDMARNSGGIIDDRAPVFPAIARDTPVAITGGSFSGRAGLLQMADDQRAVVMLSLLGREVPVSVQRRFVERV